MTGKEETIRRARRVSEMVKTYMTVQDDLFRPSLRKILRIPGIYKAVDYDKNEKILDGLLIDLAEVKSAIRQGAPEASPEETPFLGALRGYVALMTGAVERLRDICGRLDERSRGGGYKKEEYMKDMTELRAIQKKHLEAGVKLHELMKEMDGGGDKDRAG